MRNRYELGKSHESFDDENNEAKAKSKSIHYISVILPFVAVLFILALYGVAYAIYGILPTPLKLSDEVEFLKSVI